MRHALDLGQTRMHRVHKRFLKNRFLCDAGHGRIASQRSVRRLRARSRGSGGLETIARLRERVHQWCGYVEHAASVERSYVMAETALLPEYFKSPSASSMLPAIVHKWSKPVPVKIFLMFPLGMTRISGR